MIHIVKWLSKKDHPYLNSHPRYSSLYLLNMVNSLPSSLDGTLHEDKSSRCGQQCQFMWLLWILCSYLSHHCVSVYALFISPNTSSLVSCFCHSFYSLSWHFSQGFISHLLFQLLKFLSPASWGCGCIQKVIRILRDWDWKRERKLMSPGDCSLPISAMIQGTQSPALLRGLPHVLTWWGSFLCEWTRGFLLRQPEDPKARGDVGIWVFVTSLKHQTQIQMLINF